VRSRLLQKPVCPLTELVVALNQHVPAWRRGRLKARAWFEDVERRGQFALVFDSKLSSMSVQLAHAEPTATNQSAAEPAAAEPSVSVDEPTMGMGVVEMSQGEESMEEGELVEEPAVTATTQAAGSAVAEGAVSDGSASSFHKGTAVSQVLIPQAPDESASLYAATTVVTNSSIEDAAALVSGEGSIAHDESCAGAPRSSEPRGSATQLSREEEIDRCFAANEAACRRRQQVSQTEAATQTRKARKTAENGAISHSSDASAVSAVSVATVPAPTDATPASVRTDLAPAIATAPVAAPSRGSGSLSRAPPSASTQINDAVAASTTEGKAADQSLEQLVMRCILTAGGQAGLPHIVKALQNRQGAIRRMLPAAFKVYDNFGCVEAWLRRLPEFVVEGYGPHAVARISDGRGDRPPPQQHPPRVAAPAAQPPWRPPPRPPPPAALPVHHPCPPHFGPAPFERPPPPMQMQWPPYPPPPHFMQQNRMPHRPAFPPSAQWMPPPHPAAWAPWPGPPPYYR